jgi:hypothetical protein
VRLRSVAAASATFTVVVSALIAGLISAPMAVGGYDPTARRAPRDWAPMSSQWPGRQAVSVSDVASFGKTAYAVGTTTKAKVRTPWVQMCRRRSCEAVRLPKPKRASWAVTSIDGSDRNDVWAVGWRVDRKTGERRPVFWHKTGPTWKVFEAGFKLNHNIVLTDVEVANKSKAFALGRYRHGFRKNQVTSTVYRWNGKGWKEIADVGHQKDFATPCDGWYNRDWVDVIARPGSAILIGRCGTKHRLSVLEQGNTSWRLVSGAGLPAGVTWQTGSMVGQQAWMAGMLGRRRVIVASDGSGWTRVTTKGIRPAAVINDLAGVFASKVTAVGWVPTGGRHRIAKAWRWGAGSWHETSVPAGISRSGLAAVDVHGTGPVFAVGNDMSRRPPERAIVVHSVG